MLAAVCEEEEDLGPGVDVGSLEEDRSDLWADGAVSRFSGEDAVGASALQFVSQSFGEGAFACAVGAFDGDELALHRGLCYSIVRFAGSFASPLSFYSSRGNGDFTSTGYWFFDRFAMLNETCSCHVIVISAVAFLMTY